MMNYFQLQSKFICDSFLAYLFCIITIIIFMAFLTYIREFFLIQKIVSYGILSIA